MRGNATNIVSVDSCDIGEKRGWRRMLGVVLLATVVLSFMAPRASAVNLVMNYVNAGLNPSNDANGLKLIEMMRNVESFYEDVFEMSGTVTVSYSYANLDVLGRCFTISNTECSIAIDNNTTWFYDTTPTDNNEFNMAQSLYRDLNSTQKGYYVGSPPDLLEYAFKGSANGRGPAESVSGYDLYSVALHEMGHGMGLNGLWSSEYNDGDYDFDRDFLWGNTAAVKYYSSSDPIHLAAGTNMYPGISVGRRMLPSATDLMAIETCNWDGDTSFDLPRRDFYSTASDADFNNRDNWEGHKAPTYGDDVWVRDGGNASLSANSDLRDLSVAGSTTLFTDDHTLHASRNVALGGDGTLSQITIENGGTVRADGTMTILDNGRLNMLNGAELSAYVFINDVGGQMVCAGTIDIDEEFVNNGTILVANGNLTLDGNPYMNLDGENLDDGEGNVELTGGNFTCNRPLSDSFDGDLIVHSSRTATFTEGWRLSDGGALGLWGGSSSSTRAKIDGGMFEVAGLISVDLQGQISCPSRFMSTADVSLNGAGDVLYVADDSTIEVGATFRGSGKLYVTSQSETDIEDGVVIDAILHSNGVLTIDGEGIGDVTVNSVFELGSTSAFRINASSSNCDYLDVNGAAALDGVLDIDFSTMPSAFLYTVMTYTSRTGTFDSITSDAPEYTTITPIYGATSFQLLVVHIDLPLAPVPEPGTMAMLTGLAACGLVAWRRRRK